MYTEYDKAIVAFLSSLAGIVAAFNLTGLFPWLNSTTIAAITPFVTLVLTWLIPNKPAPPPTVPEA